MRKIMYFVRLNFKRHQRKLIVMRNTVLILLISAFQVFATGSYAQTKKISLAMNDAAIRDVLYAIQKQSEFYFLYNSELIDVTKKVDITIEEEKVDQVLTRLFNKNEVDFLIKDRYIVLTPVGGNTELFAEQQQPTVSGKVTDDTGQPLPGVTIQIKGTTRGTVTDADGEYSISSLPDDATLRFSFVGMRAQEVIVGNQTRINVEMVVDAIGIEEVVAVGYGTQKKVNLTGSVGVVNSEQLEKRPVASITKALQGLTPGLNITPNSMYGGEPGASMNFNIRGVGSLSGGSPYVLVDGMPMNIDNVNPDDVESISVLKDASAAAIYGARATFGVILITTKSGATEMKMKTKYNSNFSWGAPTVLPEGINSLVFADRMNQAAINSGQNKLFSDETIERMKKYQADPENFPSMVPDPTDPNGWGYWT